MKVTKTVYLIASPSERFNNETYQFEPCVNYQVWVYPDYDEFKAIAQTEVTFEIPEEPDPRQLKLDALQTQKTKLEGDFQARITEIQRQINECLAIEA